MTRSSFDLNVAACRVLIDIIPGLEASVLMETEGLVKRLYTWAEKAEQPLQVKLLENMRNMNLEFVLQRIVFFLRFFTKNTTSRLGLRLVLTDVDR